MLQPLVCLEGQEDHPFLCLDIILITLYFTRDQQDLQEQEVLDHLLHPLLLILVIIIPLYWLLVIITFIIILQLDCIILFMEVLLLFRILRLQQQLLMPMLLKWCLIHHPCLRLRRFLKHWLQVSLFTLLLSLRYISVHIWVRSSSVISCFPLCPSL